MIKTYKSHLYFLIKIGITSAVVYWLAHTVDYAALLKTYRMFSWHTVILSLASLWCCYSLSAWRWKYILHNQEPLPFSFKDSLFIVSVGNFFNQGLPGSLGGDVYRGIALKKFGFSKSWSIQSLFVDRIFGLLSMGVVGICGLFSFDLSFLRQEDLVPLYLVLAGICIGFAVFCQIDRIKMPLKMQRFINPLQNIASMCRTLCSLKNGWFLLSGFAATFFLSLPVYLLATDLEHQLTLAAVLFVLPSVFLVSFLPISFAGWGVREVAFIALFKLFGLSSEQALSLSVVYGLVSLVSVFPGLVLYVFDLGRNASK